MSLAEELKKMENIIPLFILSSFFLNKETLLSHEMRNAATAWSYPLASIATVIAGGFFNRLKEDRDYGRAEEQMQQQSLSKIIEKHCELASSLCEQKDYQTALGCYQQAIDEFEKQYKKERTGAPSKRAELYYMQTLAAMEVHDFTLARKNLNKILQEMIDENHGLYTSVLNLFALICIKSAMYVETEAPDPVPPLEEKSDPDEIAPTQQNELLQEAKEYLERSLIKDGNQLSMRVFYEFLNGKYDIMLQHFPYQAAKGQLPYPIDEDIYQPTLFQCYAEAFFCNDDKQIAFKIALLELALLKLPTIPSYYLERAFLMKACGDAYLQASQSLVNGATIRISAIGEERREPQQEGQVQQDRTLNKVALENCAKEKYRQGIVYIDELKSVPLASSDGQTILGMQKEAVIALEKHFREQLNQNGEIQDTYQLIRKDPPTTFFSRVKGFVTSDAVTTTGKYVAIVSGAGLTYLVLKNLDGNKCQKLGSSILSKGDEWCRFLMSKTPLKNYIATATVVAAPVAVKVAQEAVTNPNSPVYKK